MIDFFNDGMMPVSGGVLDQSAWFLSAVRFVNRDENEIRGE